MSQMSDLEKARLLTGERDNKLLSLLIEEAEEFILNETNRTVIPKRIASLPRKMAIIAYNRIGTEGETARSEAGESYSFDDMPESIKRQIEKVRIARCGGHAHEAKPNGDIFSS